MNNKFIISQILRSPWFMDDTYAGSYLKLADDFLSKQDVKLDERSILLQFAQGVTVFKDVRTNAPMADAFKDLPENTTAIIPISGALTKYDVCGWFGMQSLAAMVQLASAEPNISSIVLLLDTPGGSADGSLDLALAVENAKAVKPVVAYVDGLCASAGYRVACRATSIVAKPDSIIGSIGTRLTLEFNDTQLALAGIKRVDINADSSPDKNNDVEQAKIGNYKIIKESILNPLNESFINEVKSSRPGVSADALTGKVFTSSAALNLNLIDAEGMLSDAIQAGAQLAQSSTTNNNMKTTFGQKIRQLLSLDENTEQLTEQHTQSLEQLATQNEQFQQTIDTQKSTIDAIQALFPGSTDLVSAITDVQAKAAQFDAADGGKQHRLDDNSNTDDKADNELQATLDALPHHKKLMEKTKLFN